MVLNVGVLQQRFPAGSTINPTVLHAHGLLHHASHHVKILGNGSLTKSFHIEGCTLSQQAEQKIKNAGGHVT
jgi:ribosomal protein L15